MNFFTLSRKISGPRNSFQVPIKVKMATVASAGLQLGTRMRIRIVNRLAPSISADSSSSSGMVMMNCRKQKDGERAAKEAGHDQRLERVDPADGAEHHEQGDDRHIDGHHHPAQAEQEEHLAAREAKARKAVGHQERADHPPTTARLGHDGAVHKERAELELVHAS